MQQPEKYESTKTLALQDAAEFIPQLLSKIKFTKNNSILDFGCGTGSTTVKYLLPIAEQTNSDIVGVDISEKMLNFARKNYTHPAIDYVNANIMDNQDFDNINVLLRTYGSIFSFYVLHHIQDYRLALHRLNNLLEPNGFIGLTVFTFNKLYQLYEKLKCNPIWSKYMKDLIVPDWTERGLNPVNCFENALKEANFEIIELKLQQRKYLFPNVESIADLYLTVNPMIHNIPSDLESQFRDEYIEAIKGWDEPYSDQSVCHTYDMLIAVAKKKA